VPHGEWTTSDGKLIEVDLEMVEGRLQHLRVAGGVPLLLRDAIATVLNGVPSDLGAAALAARVRAAVPFGVELVGTTPIAIAQAIRQAVNAEADGSPGRVGAFKAEEIDRLTASWKAFDWRIIPEKALDPVLNVSLDEVLADRVARGDRPPTLRFWGWTQPAVIVGRTQAVENEVDLETVRALGVAVVRRMTGGGAMFVQPHGAITYSLYLPERAVAGLSIRQSYEVCEAWVIRGLRTLGVDAHHVPINDIACADGKIGGAAQARRKGVVLHHTTIAYDMNPHEMARVLRIGREKLKDKATASAAKRVSPLIRQTALPRESIVEHLRKSFQMQFGGTLDEATTEEMTEAERLVREKYGAEEWTRAFG